MNQKHDLETYSRLAEGASFFLDESFHYMNESLIDELASIIFSNELKAIDPNLTDFERIKDLNLPENPIELLQFEAEPLSEFTLTNITEAWRRALSLSRTRSHKFGYDHTINSISILGHLNNLGFFLETIINRHLLFLNHTGKLDNLSYTRISVAKIMERIIFIFKEDWASQKIHLNEIVNLYTLRNKTVHYILPITQLLLNQDLRVNSNMEPKC